MLGDFQLVLVAAAASAVAVVAFALFKRPRLCPKCGGKLPMIRRPASKEQMLYGGTTCPHCGVELDRTGKIKQG